MAYTLDEFMKLNKGFTKSWDQATGTAGVTNTNTGQSIKFKEGQGSEYGLGGIENQSHIITDLNKFNTSIGNIPEVKTVEPVNAYEPSSTNAYESPYSTDITNTLAAITNRPSFSYDAASDQGLIAAQNNAMEAVSREAARRGMLYTDSNKDQLGKSSMALIPEFQQTAYNQYNQQGTDLYNKLNTLSGLESENYKRYINETNATQALEEQNRQMWLDTMGQFSNNYQAQYNQVANDGDTSNDWQLDYLQSARQDKINQLGLDQDGNPLPVEPEVAQIASSTAMSLWKQLGKANQSIANALGIPVGTVYQEAYNGGTGSGTTSTTTPTTTPTSGYTGGQYGEYINQRDSLINRYRNNPQGMIDSVLGDVTTLTSLIGETLYNQLLDDVQNSINNQSAQPVSSTVTEPVDYTTKQYTDFMENTGMVSFDSTGRLTPLDGTQQAKVRAYLGTLAQQGVDETVLDSIASAYGVLPLGVNSSMVLAH